MNFTKKTILAALAAIVVVGATATFAQTSFADTTTQTDKTESTQENTSDDTNLKTDKTKTTQENTSDDTNLKTDKTKTTKENTSDDINNCPRPDLGHRHHRHPRHEGFNKNERGSHRDHGKGRKPHREPRRPDPSVIAKEADVAQADVETLLQALQAKRQEHFEKIRKLAEEENMNVREYIKSMKDANQDEIIEPPFRLRDGGEIPEETMTALSKETSLSKTVITKIMKAMQDLRPQR